MQIMAPGEALDTDEAERMKQFPCIICGRPGELTSVFGPDGWSVAMMLCQDCKIHPEIIGLSLNKLVYTVIEVHRESIKGEGR
jgi:hypothetical protein